MAEARSKRRFRFSLRALILLTTLVAVATWWVVAQLRWIEQRREFVYMRVANSTTRAPWPLWLFREWAADVVIVGDYNNHAYLLNKQVWPDSLDEQTTEKFLTSDDREKMKRAKVLFPEAKKVEVHFLPSSGEIEKINSNLPWPE
jgi:hypothetical protein